MQNVSGLLCLRCGEKDYLKVEASYLAKGCPRCATSDSVANLTVRYEDNNKTDITPSTFLDRESSMWRYSEFLPFEPEHAVTIGEGMAPLIPCTRMVKQLGVRQLYLKDKTSCVKKSV